MNSIVEIKDVWKKFPMKRGQARIQGVYGDFAHGSSTGARILISGRYKA